MKINKPHYWALCHGCKVKHPIWNSPGDVGVSEKFGDFANNHRSPYCAVALIPQLHTYEGRWGGRWTDLIRRHFWKPAYSLVQDAFDEAMAYTPNADNKEAFQAIQTLAVVSLGGLASSPTAGWQGAQQDNTSNLFKDSMMQFTNTAVNTAPGGSKAIYFFAFGGNATGVLTNFGAAVTGTTETTLTFPDVTANPVPGLVCVHPYQVQNVAMVSPPFAMATPFGGVLPSFWGVAAVNHTGMTLGTVTMKYQGEYETII